MKKETLNICICLFITVPAFAQNSLLQDSLFFKSQAVIYQKWLEQSGLSSLVSVSDVAIKPQSIEVILIGNTSDYRDFWSYWKQWSLDFRTEKTISLEQQLFYKLHHMMDVEQEQITLNVYDRLPGFCHRIYISFSNGKVQVRRQSCRAKERDIEVSPASFYGMKDISYEQIKKQYNKFAVFNAILTYAEGKYRKSKCEMRYPEVTLLEKEDVLRFVVTDLCKEVLKDETDPFICKVLRRFGHQCNWIKREKLEFLITYQTLPEGIKIGVEIDGKYGSGYYENVKRGGYHLMDIDFDEYLEDYADQMKNEFKKVILNIGD